MANKYTHEMFIKERVRRLCKVDQNFIDTTKIDLLKQLNNSKLSIKSTKIKQEFANVSSSEKISHM